MKLINRLSIAAVEERKKQFPITLNSDMKWILPVLLVVVIMFCPTPGFAARQVIAGGGDNALDPDGVTDGVDMQGPAGSRLTVGTYGGPQMDIFTNNAGPLAITPEAVSTSSSGDHNIKFNTSSDVNGVIGGPSELFQKITLAGGEGAEVNFLRTVYTTTMDVDRGTANFLSGTGTNVGAVNFTGDGTVRLGPNTTVTGALTTGTAETGTLVLDSGSQWTGAVGGATGIRSVNVTGGSNTAGISAGITGAVDTYSFDLGTNTLNINGDIRIRNPGPNSINTTLASSTVYGNIVQSGGATTLPATLGVNVFVPSETYIPVGTEFDILDAETGPGTSVVSVTAEDPTNPLYEFEAVPKEGTKLGDVTIKMTAAPITAPIDNPPDDPLVPIVEPVVEPLVNTPSSPDLDEVRAAINTLSDPIDVVYSEAQLAPLAPALAAPLVTFQGTRRFQDLWLTRLNCREISNLSDEDDLRRQENKPEHNWWAKEVGHWGDQKDSGGYKGFKTRTLSTMIGYDAPVAPDTRAGLAIGYAQNTIDGKTYDTSTDFDAYRAMAYVGHELGSWFVNGNLSFGWNEYSGSRHILFPGINRTADADYDGQDYTAFANIGRHFQAKNFIITPFASLQYTHVDIGSYTETGAGDINLKVESQNYDFPEAGLGVKAAHKFNFRGNIFIPEIHFKWLHVFSNPTLEQTTRFNVAGASSFTTHGLKVSDDTYNAGIGFTLLSCERRETIWSVEAGYDYEWRDDDYSANQGIITFTKSF